MGVQGHTTRLAQCLQRLHNGDSDARSDLIEHACERLRRLTHRMLRGYQHVRRWSETDDVLQNALVRLHRSLAEVSPITPREFYGLAATQIRRELIDLARHYYGVMGCGANHHTDGGIAVESLCRESCEPGCLEGWAKFHEEVNQMPDDQRSAVELLWYEGITQAEAADVLGVSLATLKRRWQAARLALSDRLNSQDFE